MAGVLERRASTSMSLSVLNALSTAGSHIVQVNLPFKQRTTISVLHDEPMQNVFSVLCEKRQLNQKDHMLVVTRADGTEEPIPLGATFSQIDPREPPHEISLVRVKRRSLLLPAASKHTNRRAAQEPPQPRTPSKMPDSPGSEGRDGESPSSIGKSGASSHTNSPKNTSGYAQAGESRTLSSIKRSVSISLGLRRPRSAELGPVSAPENVDTTSTSSSAEAELENRSISPDSVFTAYSYEGLEPGSGSLANLTLNASLDSLEASSEKLNLDGVGLTKGTGASKILKSKAVRPRSTTMHHNGRPQSMYDEPNAGTPPRQSNLPSALVPAAPDDLLVKILLSNGQHTLIKAREDSVMEDILREVCSRKGFDFYTVTLEFAETRMPVEMDRKIGSFKLKEYVFRLILSGVKSYSSMYISEQGRDVMLLTNVDGRLEMVAATPEKLVEQITDPQHDDPALMVVMLMGYRSAMTAEEFLGYLIDRFNAELPDNPTDEERTFYQSTIIIVRAKVLDVIHWWVSNYWVDFQTHAALRKALNGFVNAVVQQLAGAHENILESAAKVQALLAEKDAVTVNLLRSTKSMNRKSKVLESQFFATKQTHLAQQLCVLNHAILSEVASIEYLNMVWNNLSEEQLWDECPNLAEFIDRFNRESVWTAIEILEVPELPQRIKALTRMIEIVRESLELNNFFSVFAMLTGLGSAPISRLKKTWAGLPAPVRKLHEDLEKLTDPSKNMGKYRELLAKSKPPLVPFLPIIIKDLTFMNDGNPALIDGLINVDKLRTMTGKVIDVVRTLRTPYQFQPDAHVLNYLRHARVLPKERLSAMSEALEPRE